MTKDSLTGEALTQQAAAVLHSVYAMEQVRLTRIPTGHINVTFRVDTPSAGPFVLQRVSPIFAPEVNLDIAALVPHLERAGLLTPLLVAVPHTGALWTTDAHGYVWRVMTFVDGVVVTQAQSADQCGEAGALAARFHQALCPVRHVFRAPQRIVHDTARHLQHLREVLLAYGQHPAFAQLAPMAEAILRAAADLPPLGKLPQRLVHGDMKISNIVFSQEGQALAFIDLDTLAYMSFPVELGDALRSWCGRGGEESTDTEFDLAWFEAALVGYHQAAPQLLTPVEVRAVVPAVETICIELAARFAADAFEESYFGWNSELYTAAWQHNRVRAASQLHLAQSLVARRAQAAHIVENIFA